MMVRIKYPDFLALKFVVMVTIQAFLLHSNQKIECVYEQQQFAVLEGRCILMIKIAFTDKLNVKAFS